MLSLITIELETGSCNQIDLHHWKYGNKKPVTEYLKPETFGLSNDDCRHKKVIDILDKHSFKPLSALKDDQGFAKLKWFNHFRLKTPLENFSSRNDLTLMSTGVKLPSVKKVITTYGLITRKEAKS